MACGADTRSKLSMMPRAPVAPRHPAVILWAISVGTVILFVLLLLFMHTFQITGDDLVTLIVNAFM
jgi:hypothetical protein